MKVLWITNIKLPPLSEYLKEKPIAIGGWMISGLNQLKKIPEIELAVATYDKGTKILDAVVDGIRYFTVPMKGHNPQKYNKHLESEWTEVNKRFMPDVVHIHGTELGHGLAWVNANGAKNVCVSIQGLVSVCERYYKTDSLLDYIPLTFRDLVRFDWISRQRNNFKSRGKNEIKLLQSVNHIIGRTEWDKTHAWAINPTAKYHYCSETLREEFYKHKWEYKNCEPHTIFVSQGNYPIKGLHKILEAMPLVLRDFPDTHLNIAGWNILETSWYRKSSYAVILKKLIRKNKLVGKISFLGMLDEKQMCEQYLKNNIFVLPSAIENSPNSLGEAQLLGMPCLASAVGGVQQLVNNNPDVLYRYDETEILAKKICEIFVLAEKYQNNNYHIDDKYNSKHNAINLLSIYKETKGQ